MHAFLKFLDENVMSIVNGWVKLDKPLAEWDKNMLTLSNTNI